VRRKILIVDDDRVTLTMLEMILSRHKYQVLSARDGSQGLEQVKQEHPDVVICDMLIPKIHGLELCKMIKQNPDIMQTKVILMTAVYKGTAFKFEAKNCGADSFIEKPINTNELLAFLDEMFESTQEQENPT
jgi:sigma-B regulation protein RsbU (phosphoserine phosphatase)